MGKTKSYRKGGVYQKVQKYVNKIRHHFNIENKSEENVSFGTIADIGNNSGIDNNNNNNNTISRRSSIRKNKKVQERMRPTFIEESFRLHEDPISNSVASKIEITSIKGVTSEKPLDVVYNKKLLNSLSDSKVDYYQSYTNKDELDKRHDSSLSYFENNQLNYTNKDMSTHQMIAEYDTSENKFNVQMKKLTYQELLSSELIIEEMKDSIIWKPTNPSSSYDNEPNCCPNSAKKNINNMEMSSLSAYLDATIEQLQQSPSTDSMQWWLEEYKYSNIFE